MMQSLILLFSGGESRRAKGKIIFYFLKIISSKFYITKKVEPVTHHNETKHPKPQQVITSIPKIGFNEEFAKSPETSRKSSFSSSSSFSNLEQIEVYWQHFCINNFIGTVFLIKSPMIY